MTNEQICLSKMSCLDGNSFYLFIYLRIRSRNFWASLISETPAISLINIISSDKYESLSPTRLPYSLIWEWYKNHCERETMRGDNDSVEGTLMIGLIHSFPVVKILYHTDMFTRGKQLSWHWKHVNGTKVGS